MPVFGRKYSRAWLFVLLFFLQGFLWGGCGRMNFPGGNRNARSQETVVPSADGQLAGSGGEADTTLAGLVPEETMAPDSMLILADSVVGADSLLAEGLKSDVLADSLLADSLAADSVKRDSLVQRDYGKPFLDEIITGKNLDSLVYDAKEGMIYVYNEAEIQYTEQTFKADYLVMDMDGKVLYGRGMPDTAGVMTRPVLIDQGHEYDMDSIYYNLGTGKSLIRGVWTTEGDGFLRAAVIKKLPDNTFNIARGTYTTCDAEHPHFYFRMAKARTIPGKKTIFGYTYIVIEDVPIIFPGLPFGFFPMSSERKSGFIIPSFGEESRRGFFLRDGGYYFAPNDYVDMSLLGGVYTLGSWEAKFASRYRMRYRFNGGINLQYSDLRLGDRLSGDLQNTISYRIAWNHSQDPKARPGQTFSASVDYSSSKHNQYGAASLNEFIRSQASSSISYSKNWTGSPFSMSGSMRVDQSFADTTATMGLTLPQFSLNMTTVKPFKFKNRRPGPERWYEKIAMSYSGSLNNHVSNVREEDMFSKEMFERLETSMTHSIPVNASFTVLNYINLTAGGSYSENWNTRKVYQNWDAEAGSLARDTVMGFHRVYRYSGSLSANTTLFGMYDNFRPGSKFEAVRHTVAPSVSFSFSPDFSKERFGFYQPYQTNADGDIGLYSPYIGAPGRGASAALNFTLKQSVEAKIRSDRDSTGTRKIKIIDDLTIGSISYNFIADSMRLSQSVPVSLRSTLFKGFNINLNTSLGLYAAENGRLVDKLLWSQGRLPRIERFSTSFNKNWSFGKSSGADPNARNAGNNITDMQNNMFNDPFDPLNPNVDPELQQMDEQNRMADIQAYRSLLTSQYYDFSIPLNINFTYNISYSNPGTSPSTITQTCSFGASMNLTPKWGITISSGYDFVNKGLTSNTNFTLTRDLHCMQMNFSWIPIGPYKSWNFHISVKANVLRDLKYEKSGSRWDR